MSFSKVKTTARSAADSAVRLPQAATTLLATLPIGGFFKRPAAAPLLASSATQSRYREQQARYHAQYRRVVAFCPPPLKSW